MDYRVEKLVNQDEHGKGEQEQNEDETRVRDPETDGRETNEVPAIANKEGNAEPDRNSDELHHNRAWLTDGTPRAVWLKLVRNGT